MYTHITRKTIEFCVLKLLPIYLGTLSLLLEIQQDCVFRGVSLSLMHQEAVHLHVLKIIAQSNSPAVNARNENQKAGKVISFLSNTLKEAQYTKDSFSFWRATCLSASHTVLGLHLYIVTIGLVQTEQNKRERKG